jgi:hypothetical protein
LIILCILFEQYILIQFGLWSLNEREVKSLQEAYDRIAKSNSVDLNNLRIEYDKLISKSIQTHNFSRDKRGEKKEDQENEGLNLDENNYFAKLFPKIRVRIYNIF